MKAASTALPGVIVLEPSLFGDDRGFFMETWNSRTFADIGITASFVQDNHSCSGANVLRGLHYQQHFPQGKLVRVTAGAAFDVAVDIRPGSATFGRSAACVLTAENRRMMWIPPGFAHGFLSLMEGTEFLYKCTAHYSPADERTILWCDPALAIDWPLGGGMPRLSAKDAAAPMLAELEVAA